MPKLTSINSKIAKTKDVKLSKNSENIFTFSNNTIFKI